MNTKDKILYAGLDLFSQYGYSDVSVEKIATAVGIKAPSIYKHYRSKKEIFTSILDLAKLKFDDRFNFSLDCEASNLEDVKVNLENLGIEIFEYLLHDEYISKTRKMLALEMYKNDDAMQLYIKNFIEHPIAQHGIILQKFGKYNEEYSKLLSTIFYSPIYLAVRIYDSNPEKEEELVELLKDSYKRLEKLLSD